MAAPQEELFATLDPQPMAAAALAQVHAATLPDGSEVVIKVQRPDIEWMKGTSRTGENGEKQGRTVDRS